MPRDSKLVAAEAALRAAEDRKRRRTMGPPLNLSDAALEQASVVGAGDAAVAGATWDRDSGLPGLLDAEVVER